MTVQLPPDLMKIVEARVASGDFSSAEEVVRAALVWFEMDDQQLDPMDEDWLREAIAEGKASGDPVEVDLDELRARLKAGLPWRS